MAKTFLGTTIPYTLLGPSPGTTYTPLYRANGETGAALASVNAGNPALFVGGGGINAAFAGLIQAACPAFSANPAALQSYFNAIHPAAVAAAQKGQPVTVLSDPARPVRLISVVLPATPPVAKAQANTEAALLDIFTPGLCPHANPRNAAMLYLVPPDGNNRAAYPTAATFLAAVGRTAQNGVAVLADYNAKQIAAHPALALAPIPVLRMCLISGSIFRPSGVPVALIATAIFDGLARGLVAAGAAGGITLVEFENGDGGFAALP